MKLAGTTKVLGIFGDPIAHSLSPRMQNAAIEAAGINAVYVPFHVTPAELGTAVAAIRSLGLLGVNVTVPHKEAVLPLLDEVDEVAAQIGAVNTIVNRGGRLVGYNTAASGLMRALHAELSCETAGKQVVVLGAGGAARAAVVAIAKAGARRIVIANRTADKAEKLFNVFRDQSLNADLLPLALDDPRLDALLAEADLLVNTTTVGLHGEHFTRPLVENLPGTASVYDMVYAAQPTPLQGVTEAAGLAFADGRGMLAGQGAEAFSLWFDTVAPLKVMRAAIG